MMTSIPGTDLTTEAARNRAARMLNEHDAQLMIALADAYDDYHASFLDAVSANVEAFVNSAVEHARAIADRVKYSPQESAAAWDVVDALQTLTTASDTVTAVPDQDDRDGKQITRAAEAEDNTDECD